MARRRTRALRRNTSRTRRRQAGYSSPPKSQVKKRRRSPNETVKRRVSIRRSHLGAMLKPIRATRDVPITQRIISPLKRKKAQRNRYIDGWTL